MKHLRLIFLIALLLAAREAQAQQKFLMGYSSFSANQTPIWVAKEEGFFKRFGTEADLILIEGGTRGRTSAYLGRSADHGDVGTARYQRPGRAAPI